MQLELPIDTKSQTQVRFLLGPAGSGKTWQCLDEIRRTLIASAEGAPLIFLAPRQSTFQLEYQLLQDGSLKGYNRLRIFSFERLANFVYESMGVGAPDLLSEQGRVMVLRALLSEHFGELSIFRSCARRIGFADELSGQIREFQAHGLLPDDLRNWAAQGPRTERLRAKLTDLALLYEHYRAWLQKNHLQDADSIVASASELLEKSDPRKNPFKVAALYLDGFAQLTPEERRFLFALLRHCERSTLAICLDADVSNPPLRSSWSLAFKMFNECFGIARDRFGAEAVTVTALNRKRSSSRFTGSGSLAHLEESWNSPKPLEESGAVRLIECPDPAAEALFCARQIHRYVLAGGRYRDIAVLARDFENDYPHLLRRELRRFGIPFFLDHRESVAHHPLAELTRGALRTIAYGWKRQDWFAVLKSGLVFNDSKVIDSLENEVLARGWEGDVWLNGFVIRKDERRAADLNGVREQLVRPFVHFAKSLRHEPSGPEFADALRELWAELKVEKQLDEWISEPGDVVHSTVWTQTQEWLENLSLAFRRQRNSVRDWIPIIEAGLDGLTVGVIPPVLDQVLIGAVDRSRNPDLKKVFILGFNEGVFPALPRQHRLLTEHDREGLMDVGVEFCNVPAMQMCEENFYGYIAATRARSELCISWSKSGSDGKALNPSRFVPRLQRIFPNLQVASWAPPEFLNDVIHPCELGPLLDGELAPEPDQKETLVPATTARLYGKELEAGVSSMERFAMCPFRFFLEKGLGVEERIQFELDIREQGSFQHEVLSAFHLELKSEGREWRSITAAEASLRIGRIADQIIATFRDGLLEATKPNQFIAECYKESLQEFIQVVIDWFNSNSFDPQFVELPFGPGKPIPAWRIPLKNGNTLVLKGRIDRVDLKRTEDQKAYCVIFDYKSGLRKPEEVLLQHGIQQQLTGYLLALVNIPEARAALGVDEIIPAGCFLIPLRPSYASSKSRKDARKSDEALPRAYTHKGIFDWERLGDLDSDPNGSFQFDYKETKGGGPSKQTFSGMGPDQFQAILNQTGELLWKFGERIYAGDISIHPYRKGAATACDNCRFPSICRFDPWVQQFNDLKKAGKGVNSKAKK